MSSLIEKTVDTVYTPAGEQWGKTWHGLEEQVSGGIAIDGNNIPNVFCPILECNGKYARASRTSS
ncbi:MAG: hypothetical protein AABY22_32215, partial [Nanoarchaeota archaeon]